MMSLPYFAPIGDAALRFDTDNAVAKAALPDGLLAGGNGIAMSCWMTSPGEKENALPVVVVGNNTGGFALGFADGHAHVLQFHGPADGSGELGWSGASAKHKPLPVGAWIYVAVRCVDPGSIEAVGVGEGQPVLGRFAESPPDTEAFRHATVAIVGKSLGAWPKKDLGRYRGAIARLRLWRTALSVDQLVAARFDLPVTPGAGQAPSPAVDWRMTEGYGDVAFDYAAPASERLPSRLGSPPGNHLRFGEGAGAPTWIMANIPVPPHGMVRA